MVLCSAVCKRQPFYMTTSLRSSRTVASTCSQERGADLYAQCDIVVISSAQVAAAAASGDSVQTMSNLLDINAACAAGSVFYGIYYASFYTQYLQLLAAYSLAQPTSEEVLAGQAGSFQGALAASGRLEVPLANTPISSLIEPPCSGAICPQSMYALAPDTAYQVCTRGNFMAL